MAFTSAFSLLVVISIYLLSMIQFACTNRVFEKMYENIQSDFACFKRFNGTHEIGCTSSFWGNVGVIQLIEDEANVTSFLKDAAHPPYVLALVPELFTVEVLESVAYSGKLSGIVVLGSSHYPIPEHFSGDKTCPNKESSMYTNSSLSEYCSDNPWNPYGSSLLFMSWNFPIFFLKDDDSVEKIIKCFNDFNKPIEGHPVDWPLCAIELHSNMYATTNSEVCMRRSSSSSVFVSLCEPLEDINVWGSIHPFNNTLPIPAESITIVSTSSDAASLFDNISPGANAAITGLVALLVTAEALFRYEEDFNNTESNVLFTVFEGEAWDYIGSSAMVYDMVNDQFPYKTIDEQQDQMSKLNLSHIGAIIDLKQVGFVSKQNGSKFMFMHTDPKSNIDEDVHLKTTQLTSTLKSQSKSFDVDFKYAEDETPLPPSSFQSFLKQKNIPGVVLADHLEGYENKYYMSIYDDAENLKFKSTSNGTDESDTVHKDIAEVASTVASTLYNILTGEEKKIEANQSLTNELLYCFLQNMNCTYLQENSDARLKKILTPMPAKTFVSIQRATNPLSILTYRLLSRYLGRVVELNETECKSNVTQVMTLIYFPYIDNGTCFETSVHHSDALSPAFIIKGYDWKSNEYSTWTESTWSQSEARIFLRPSPTEETGLLIAGVISMVLSILIVYFLDSKAKIIFESAVTPTPC